MFETEEFDGPTPEQWAEYCQGRLLKNPPWKRWLLRNPVRTARYFHDCDYCYMPIEPGNSYVEEVYACRGKIEVRRHHWPECPRDPWDEDESFDDDFDDVPKTVPFRAPLRQAA